MLLSLINRFTTRPQPGTGYFILSRTRLSLSPIRLKLKKHNYPTTPVSYNTYGGGMYSVYADGLMVGGEGDGGGSAHIGKSTNRYAGGGQGFFNVGYVLQSSKRFRIYVMSGIGGGGGGMSTGEKHPENPLRMKPETVIGIGGGGVRTYFGLGIEFHQFGFVIGARFGVMFLPPLLHFGNESRIKPFIRFIAGISGGSVLPCLKFWD